MIITTAIEIISILDFAFLGSFDPASHDEIQRVIMSTNNTSSVIDPIPPLLLKSCIIELLSIIVKLIRQTFATLLKSAIVNHI